MAFSSYGFGFFIYLVFYLYVGQYHSFIFYAQTGSHSNIVSKLIIPNKGSVEHWTCALMALG